MRNGMRLFLMAFALVIAVGCDRAFRFEPPAAWRLSVPPRDGKTYPFRVMRAVFDAAR